MNVKRKKSGFTPLEIEISNWAGNRRSKRFLTGFTIVELLTTLAIIGMLVSLLIPALSLVRNIAKETKQRAQLTTIGLALTTFKTDYGDYPPSVGRDDRGNHYGGAQKLAEALLGWDLLGFHPKSAWRADGLDAIGGSGTYDPLKTRDDNKDGVLDTLNERRGRYLELATANAFTLKQLFGSDIMPFNKDEEMSRYVICDVFAVKKVTITQPGGKSTTFKAGTPILYYKANVSSKVFHTGWPNERIYDYSDNINLILLGKLPDREKPHKLGEPNPLYLYDPEYKLVDPKASASMGLGVTWPYRPDSYILITAGADGEYGTADDICNF